MHASYRRPAGSERGVPSPRRRPYLRARRRGLGRAGTAPTAQAVSATSRSHAPDRRPDFGLLRPGPAEAREGAVRAEAEWHLGAQAAPTPAEPASRRLRSKQRPRIGTLGTPHTGSQEAGQPRTGAAGDSDSPCTQSTVRRDLEQGHFPEGLAPEDVAPEPCDPLASAGGKPGAGTRFYPALGLNPRRCAAGEEPRRRRWGRGLHAAWSRASPSRVSPRRVFPPG